MFLNSKSIESNTFVYRNQGWIGFYPTVCCRVMPESEVLSSRAGLMGSGWTWQALSSICLGYKLNPTITGLPEKRQDAIEQNNDLNPLGTRHSNIKLTTVRLQPGSSTVTIKFIIDLTRKTSRVFSKCVRQQSYRTCCRTVVFLTGPGQLLVFFVGSSCQVVKNPKSIPKLETSHTYPRSGIGVQQECPPNLTMHLNLYHN